MHGFVESKEAKYYRQKAEAETARLGRMVTALEMIERDIKELTSQTSVMPDLEMLESRLKTLKKTKIEIKPREMYEGQIIFRDAQKSTRVLPISGEGDGYREFEIDERRVLRIRVLHPDPPEWKLGADLVYENYDIGDETVRLAIVQYKIWEKNNLYRDTRADNQLDKMYAIACRKGGLCTIPDDEELWSYRLPYCAAFFRPTDRLQTPNSALQSSGLHIPLCAVNFSWELTDKGGSVLRKANVMTNAVTHTVFEEMFVCSALGSRKITWSQLEDLYREHDIFEHEETVTLHVQEFAR